MKERLEQFLSDQQLKPGKFAQIMEVQPSNITHIISGRSKPGFEFISKMLTKFPNLNPDWLIMGAGEMYRIPEQLDVFEAPEHPEPEVLSEAPQEESPKEDVSIPAALVSSNDDITEIIVFYKDGTFRQYKQR